MLRTPSLHILLLERGRAPTCPEHHHASPKDVRVHHCCCVGAFADANVLEEEVVSVEDLMRTSRWFVIRAPK